MKCETSDMGLYFSWFTSQSTTRDILLLLNEQSDIWVANYCLIYRTKSNEFQALILKFTWKILNLNNGKNTHDGNGIQSWKENVTLSCVTYKCRYLSLSFQNMRYMAWTHLSFKNMRYMGVWHLQMWGLKNIFPTYNGECIFQIIICHKTNTC